ncbi:ankyrin repeat-containing domain protein [Mariannaea sp. PMI_226]|nr:ankyrin repeat-containing domain protein [Mariannaea sp. PMI_226]
MRNDTAALRHYLANVPFSISPMDGPPYNDVFYKAAQNGSVEALQILLEHQASHPVRSSMHIEPFKEDRGFLLLNVAAFFGHTNLVRFLLDSQPLYARIHAKDPTGHTALLSAASLCKNDRLESGPWEPERVDRSDQVMHLLLDRGADPRDVLFQRVFSCQNLPNYNQDDLDTVPGKELLFETVLSLAICWAPPKLLKRLIDGGADVHARIMSYNEVDWFPMEEEFVYNLTPLFSGSLYGNDIELAEMVSRCDSRGRLPLHLAASNVFNEETIPAPIVLQIIQQITSTIKVLLASNPATINIQDKHGNTPLHYAAMYYSHKVPESTIIFRALCDAGADAGLKIEFGQTALHTLCYPSGTLNPTDEMAVMLLLEAGARITDTDKYGNNPLHYAAADWQNVGLVMILLKLGADITLEGSQWDTAFDRAGQGNIGLPPKLGDDAMIESRDRMMKALEKAGGDRVLDQPNTEGMSARQLLREARTYSMELKECEKSISHCIDWDMRPSPPAMRRVANWMWEAPWGHNPLF